MKLTHYLRYLPLVAIPTVVTAADINVTADITANTTWTADNTYIISKSVFVKNGATLTIEPGTLILGANAAGQDAILDTADDTYGSLVVARGAKLMAEGTAERPIVFTAKEERDGLDDDGETFPDPAQGDGAFWGGIILLGDAPINFYVGGTNANENSIEGFPGGSSADILYGGTDAADNSGVLKYVSIRFGGYVYTSGKEINGLTLGGVGSGTTIENVEVVSNTDDGVEIFGGTVNTKRIAVAFCQDDSFDLDEGHSGHHQFWFALQNADPAFGDRGGEWDGGNGNTTAGTPHTTAKIFNATFIGNSATAAASTNAAFYLDDYFSGQLHNSVIHQFSGNAIDKAADGVGDGVTTAAPSVFSNNTWGSFGGTAGLLATLNAAGSPTGTGNSAIGTDPLLGSIGRTPNGGLDPRPQAGSPALTANGATLSTFPAGAPAGFFESTNYRGAFGSGSANWLRGWSYLDKKGYLGEVLVTADITTNTTWTADKTYVLNKSIFVKNGATLTIEPGTRILGANAAGQDAILDTADDTYGSLVIARGAKLMAEGTAENPIVFTAYEEVHGIDGNPMALLDPAQGDGAFWGGIILLGDAPINFYVGGTNANENSIEGFPGGSSADILYGGTDAADNSGVLKYVSIRFGGYVYTSGKEINGLTLGGVGSGTTIENVEVVSNTDDGVEIFGGTVNTKRIAVAFCQDDSFDLDEGHSGHHQFWFALQNADPAFGDRGGEWDGGNGNTTAGTPHTTAKIFNATFIGNSATAAASTNAAFYLDDYFSGQLHNSVIHQFSGNAIDKAADGVGDGVTTAAPSVFSNNTWGSFGGTAGLLATLNAAGSPTGTGNSAIGAIPNLGGISRVPNQGLDPRPNTASPLFTANGATLSTFPAGAPAGFFETTSYRGAFGSSSWLDGWSYLSQFGYLGDLSDVVEDVDTDGDGLTDSEEGTHGTNPALADTDGDGLSDGLEVTKFALGFNPLVADAALLDNLYTEDAIQDLVTGNQVMVQRDGTNVTLSIPVFRSSDLTVPFAPAPALEATFEALPEKEFYRIEVPSAE